MLHDIDARFPIVVTHLGPFDCIIFNFPHVGGDDTCTRTSEENQELLRDFFRGCQYASTCSLLLLHCRLAVSLFFGCAATLANNRQSTATVAACAVPSGAVLSFAVLS